MSSLRKKRAPKVETKDDYMTARGASNHLSDALYDIECTIFDIKVHLWEEGGEDEPCVEVPLTPREQEFVAKLEDVRARIAKIMEDLPTYAPVAESKKEDKE